MKNNNETLQLLTLEEQYPEFNKKKQGYTIIDFVKDPNDKQNRLLVGKRTFRNPSGLVPIWRKTDWDIGKKYTGEKLRELRQKRLKEFEATNERND